jgi:hypothetical protein
VWDEAEEPRYAQRLAAAGFDVTRHPVGAAGHVVYVGQRHA